MDNTYRKLFQVLRSWCLVVLLFAFAPMVQAQEITGITPLPASQYPGEDITVNVAVEDFTDAEDYAYYLVFVYGAQNYGKLFEFEVTTVDFTLVDVDGNGTIALTSEIPVELYRYGAGRLAVVVIDNAGDLVYQAEEPYLEGSEYPSAGFHDLNGYSFTSYHNTVRAFETDVYYAFDASTSFTFVLTRANDGPAVNNEILVQYKAGTGNWTTIKELDLNNYGSTVVNRTVSVNSADPDWPEDIEDNDIQLRVYQPGSQTLAAGIDTWTISDFYVFGVVGEADAEHNYTQVLGYWVNDVVDFFEPGLNNFTILAPNFTIAFNTLGVDLYPGAEVTYTITGVTNVAFPASTLFEVYMRNDLDEEILLDYITLADFPDVGVTEEYTFNLPFRTDGNWTFYVRADLRNSVVQRQAGPFNILPVNLLAELDLDETPAAQKFELDGVTFLFPGSEITVNYELDVDQTINTDYLDLEIVLEYNNGSGWRELARDDFSIAADQSITGNLPEAGMISVDEIDLRVRLVYGDHKDMLSSTISRSVNWDSNQDASFVSWYFGTVNAGSEAGMHVFVSTTVAQTLVLEYIHNGLENYQVLTTVAVPANADYYALHFARDLFAGIVPQDELTAENVRIRMRWADGGPLANNIALYKGFRLQWPAAELNVVSNVETADILYPWLTLSTILSEDPYLFADVEDTAEVTVDYSTYGMPAGTQIAVVLTEVGGNPFNDDPYMYLGSKAVGADNGEDTQIFTIALADLAAFLQLDELTDFAQIPDVELFQLHVIATEKDAADPIIFKTVEVEVQWNNNFNDQPLMLTQALNLVGMAEPLYLAYDWIVTQAPNPLNGFTTPVLEYSVNEGQTWTQIDQHPFNTMLEIEEDWVSEKTYFRWKQQVNQGQWDVQNVQILAGEDNLANFYYETEGTPQVIAFALEEQEVIIPDDPCDDFNLASLAAYGFTTDTETVAAGDQFAFNWEFLRHETAVGKAIEDVGFNVYNPYVHGENHQQIYVSFNSDKKLTELQLTFPEDVVPTEAMNVNVEGNTLVAVVSETNRTITWTSDAGAIMQGFMLNMVFTVDETINDAIEVEYSLTDVDGTVEGVFEIHPGQEFPEGTIFTFYIWRSGQPVRLIYETTETGAFVATIPELVPTGSYNVYARASYQTVDEVGDDVNCGITGYRLVHSDLFIFADEAPEVYEIELLDVVNLLDPEKENEFYWGQDVDVIFETFGPWGDFDNLNFEVGLVADEKEVLFYENFANGVLPVGWSNVDQNGDGYNWEFPAWGGVDGEFVAASFSWDPFAGPLAPDNWLITPQLSIEEETNLAFWVKGQDEDWPFEYYSVWVSTTGNNPSDFAYQIHSETLTDGEWKQILVSLDAFAGDDIYIAFRHHNSSDMFAMAIDAVEIFRGSSRYFALEGAIEFVEGTSLYEATLSLPTYEELINAGVSANLTASNFEVVIRAYQGEGPLVAGALHSIEEFYLTSGTMQSVTPLTFDEENVLRYAITEKMALEQYAGQEVYMSFAYSANIPVPNFVSLPVLQYTVDGGLNYHDIPVPGSVFEEQNRLDAQAMNKVYSYLIPEEMLVDNIRFRWYQELPSGWWRIDNISIARPTNEVPIANYFINDPAYMITIMEEVIPEFCDQFDELSLTGYIWSHNEVDDVTGFEAALIAGEEFDFNWVFDENAGVDPLPEDAEYLFFIKRAVGSYKDEKAEYALANDPRNRHNFNRSFNLPLLEDLDKSNGAVASTKDDDEGEWIHWDNQENTNSIGTNSAATFSIASLWAPEDIDGFEEKQLSSIRFVPNYEDATYTVKIWVGDDRTEVYSQLATDIVVDEWNTVTLDLPHVIDVTQDLIFGVTINTQGGWPAGVDSGPAVGGKGNLMIWNGDWVLLTDLQATLNYNWNLGAYVEEVQLYLINVDGLPLTMGDDFIGFIPEMVKTGIYEVYAMAIVSDEDADIACSLGPVKVKDDLLIVNETTGPDDVHNLVLEGLFVPADDNGDIMFTTELVIGQHFNAMYSAYGPWPEGINFAAVFAGTTLGVSQEIGENEVFVDLQMPVIPIEDFVEYNVPNSPGQFAYDYNTWTELGWTEFTVSEQGTTTTVSLSFDWLTDSWPWEGSLWLRSPSGTTVQIASGLTTGNHTLSNFTEFAGEDLAGNWRLWIQDSYGDGGHQMSNISVEFAYQLPFTIYAYLGDELILGDMMMQLDMNHFDLKGYDGVAFSQEGNRYALTPVLELADLDANNATLTFNFTNYNVSPTAATLPQFQVSVNGGQSFTTLEVLMDSDQYSYDITGYLTDNTHFRWIQPANFGLNQDVWTVSNIVITSGEDNIYRRSNSIMVTQIVPQLDSDYLFAVLIDEDDLQQAIYAGNNFDFYWGPNILADSYNEYPEGTTFHLELHDLAGNVVLDSETGEPAILYVGTETGFFTGRAPMVERGVYYVHATAHYDGFVYDSGIVGQIAIFNPVIRTEMVGLDVPYAGGYVDFVGTLESNLNLSLDDSYWYNLVLVHNGDEWVIATQEGSADFNDVMLPPFVSDLKQVKIYASVGGPLADVGTIIDVSMDQTINVSATLATANNPGQKSHYDVEIDDLTDYVAVSFSLRISEELANLTDDQKVMFKYSVDGGQTFTHISTYPDARFNDPAYFDGDWFVEMELALPEAARVPGTILRWSINETKGDVHFEGLLLTAERPIHKAPYYALSTDIMIAKQRIEITATDEVNYCSSSVIEIDYNIRGGFGEEAVVYLWTDAGGMTDITFSGITSGSGTVMVSAADLNAYGRIRLQFSVEDYTFTPEYILDPISVIGDMSDVIDVVAPINEHTDIMARNAFSCETTERFMVIHHPQPYFQYQVRNAETHEMLSEPVVYIPGGSMPRGAHDLEISIGMVDSKTRAEVVVTAMSSDGSLMCETLVLDEIVVFDIRDYVLQYRMNAEIGQSWKTYTGEENFLLCENSDDLELRLWNNSTQSYLNMIDDVKWYRNNMETPLSGYILDYFPLTGSYFAVVRDPGCEDYVSVEVFVTVEEAPVKPEITFVGNYDLCEGETAMLMVSDEYAYYRWYKSSGGWRAYLEPIPGNNQNTLVIYESATYWVEVSNHEFDPHLPVCSEFSEPLVVNLNIHEKPYIGSYHVYADDLVLCESGVARIVLSWTEEDVMYQLFNINTGELSGAAQVGGQNNLILTSDELTENTHLGIIATRIGNQVCEGTRVDVNGAVKVTVYNLTILVSGNTLMASIGPDRAMSYQWYRNGVMVMNNGQSRTLNIYDDAEYSIVVETIDGCILHESTAGKDGEVDDIVDAAVNTFNIYPNPVQNQLTLQFNGLEGDVQVRIIGLGGEIVREVKYTLTESQVEETLFVEDLNQGIYMIQIIGSEHTEVKRFIKK